MPQGEKQTINASRTMLRKEMDCGKSFTGKPARAEKQAKLHRKKCAICSKSPELKEYTCLVIDSTTSKQVPHPSANNVEQMHTLCQQDMPSDGIAVESEIHDFILV